MGLSHTISKTDGDFSRKSQKNSYLPLVFCIPIEGIPLELGTGAGGQKTRMMGILGRTRSLTISSAVWIQCTNVTDGRTDTRRQQRLRLHIASRSNISRRSRGQDKHIIKQWINTLNKKIINNLQPGLCGDDPLAHSHHQTSVFCNDILLAVN